MSLHLSKAHRVIPDDVKRGYSVCVEYVDRYTPETVKTCVKTTVDSLASVLDALDKGAEITSAGVRRFLRDDLGVAQATAQNVSDVMHAGTQIAISLVPGKAVSLARSLPKLEIVRLAPSGTRASTYRFAFKDMEKSAGGVKYSSRAGMSGYKAGAHWNSLEAVNTEHAKRKIGKINKSAFGGGEIRTDGTYIYRFDNGHKTGKIHVEMYMKTSKGWKAYAEVDPHTGNIIAMAKENRVIKW